MKYLTGCYWHREDPCVSLVLKHLTYRDHNAAALGFLAVHEKAGTVLGERLNDWFYREGISLCGKRDLNPERLKWELEAVLADEIKEKQITFAAKDHGAAVILCTDHQFVLWKTGNQQIYVLNTRYNRSHIKCIGQAGEDLLLTGEYRQQVGILLASEGFYQNVTLQQMTECLAVKGLTDQEKVQKHLEELGREAVRKGGRHVGGMLLVTC